jgi:predicted nucleic acid-binding protein
MAIYYLDTSAIVKRYRVEKGTSTIDELFDHPSPQDRFYTSFLAVLELTSSVRRLVKAGQLTERIAGDIFSRFRQDIYESFRICPLDDETASHAISMIEKFGLRSADAIHMATAIFLFSAVSGSAQVMVTSDQELLQAAKASNYQVLDPQDDNSIVVLRELRANSRIS